MFLDKDQLYQLTKKKRRVAHRFKCSDINLKLRVMSSMKSASKLEKVTGSLAFESALTVVAASVGTPVAALIPVLGKSIATERQKHIVESTLKEMNDVLIKHAAQLETLNDQQFKLVNETILSLLHTTTESKTHFLKNAVEN